MLPLVPWLISVWQARAAAVPWWASLPITVGLILLPWRQHRAASNTVCALAGLALSLYVTAEMLAVEAPELIPVAFAVTLLNTLFDGSDDVPRLVTEAANVLAVAAVLFFEAPSSSSSGVAKSQTAAAAASWALATLWLTSSAFGGSRGWAILCALTAPVLALGPPQQPLGSAGWLLLLPCMCLGQANDLREGLTPALARLMQQRGLRQDVLLYCAAWAALLALLCQCLPDPALPVLLACAALRALPLRQPPAPEPPKAQTGGPVISFALLGQGGRAPHSRALAA